MMKLIFLMLSGIFMNWMIKSNLMFLILQNLYFFISLMMIIMNLVLENSWSKLYKFFGVDEYSNILNILMFFIIGLMFLSKLIFKSMISYFKMFSILLILMSMSLYMYFCSLNFLMFFIYFEMSMIPMLILILGWGYQPERIQAGIYMMMYTMFSSLPMLLLIFKIMYMKYSLSFLILLNNYVYLEFFMFYFFMLFVFLVKMPMFMIHLWLPKAHVEAPVFGSMILASIMLKLGGYGMMRCLLMMMNLSKFYNIYLMSLSLFGAFYLSLVCLRQVDMKLLVAYSSVVHMAMVIMGCMSMTFSGFMGSMILMIGHGLCSSALFILVMINYYMNSSRSMMINKGMLSYTPSLSMWWFMFCISNMGSPPSLNLLGELMIFMTVVNWSIMSIFMLMIMSFFSACYSLYLYSFNQHGGFKILLMFKIVNVNMYLMMLIHWFPLNMLILNLLLY
uniref:NADH-ubiquinone oxidoreductase chain 4 n=1 Tax=Exallonyx sp. ZJUH_2016014 TaxID=2491158 RepID=A0A3Q8UA18_9HYME|nr:NADH dehydrogenase subunit 4 [Exallonyx sp. ZJUH_2016014]